MYFIVPSDWFISFFESKDSGLTFILISGCSKEVLYDGVFQVQLDIKQGLPKKKYPIRVQQCECL